MHIVDLSLKLLWGYSGSKENKTMCYYILSFGITTLPDAPSVHKKERTKKLQGCLLYHIFVERTNVIRVQMFQLHNSETIQSV